MKNKKADEAGKNDKETGAGGNEEKGDRRRRRQKETAGEGIPK